MIVKRILYTIFTIGLIAGCAFAGATVAEAGWTWNGGEYTNFYGDSSGNSCSGQCASYCNPGTGSCGGTSVFKYTCDGKKNQCLDNEVGSAGTQSMGAPGCNKTVQIDVFDKNCRDASGAWTCIGDNLKSYMVWYSGTCSTPQPTITPVPTQSIYCNPSNLSMSVTPSTVKIGQEITFNLSGSEGDTWISDGWTGGVNCSGSLWPSKTCTATAVGTFAWTHIWKKCVGNVNNCSNSCQKVTYFTVTDTTPTITVTPVPTNTSTPEPSTTPGPTSTPGPTVTPTPGQGSPNQCGGTCGSNANCQAGYICYIADPTNHPYDGVCRNPQCQSKTDCLCQVLGAVAPTTPSTGEDIWTAGMALSILSGAGFLAKKWAGRIWIG